MSSGAWVPAADVAKHRPNAVHSFREHLEVRGISRWRRPVAREGTQDKPHRSAASRDGAHALVPLALALVAGAWLLLSASPAVADEAAAHAPEPAGSSLRGQLVDGFTDLPIVAGYVFVLGPDMKTVLGKTMTPGGRDMGRWTIGSLPSSGKVLVVGFHPKAKFALAVMETTLEGRLKNVGLLKTRATLPSVPTSGDPWGFLGQVSMEVARLVQAGEVDRLTDSLMRTRPVPETGDGRESSRDSGWIREADPSETAVLGSTSNRRAFARFLAVYKQRPAEALRAGRVMCERVRLDAPDGPVSVKQVECSVSRVQMPKGARFDWSYEVRPARDLDDGDYRFALELLRGDGSRIVAVRLFSVQAPSR